MPAEDLDHAQLVVAPAHLAHRRTGSERHGRWYRIQDAVARRLEYVVNEVYGRFFDHEPPARSTVEVANLPVGFRVEIEVVAAR